MIDWLLYLFCERRWISRPQYMKEGDTEDLRPKDPESLMPTASLRIRIPRTVSCERCNEFKVIGSRGRTPTWTCDPCDDSDDDEVSSCY